MDTALANSQSGDEAFQRTEFYAEDEQIEISPMVRSGVVSLVCGNFGPFEPSVTAKVGRICTQFLSTNLLHRAFPDPI